MVIENKCRKRHIHLFLRCLHFHMLKISATLRQNIFALCHSTQHSTQAHILAHTHTQTHKSPNGNGIGSWDQNVAFEVSKRERSRIERIPSHFNIYTVLRIWLIAHKHKYKHKHETPTIDTGKNIIIITQSIFIKT